MNLKLSLSILVLSVFTLVSTANAGLIQGAINVDNYHTVYIYPLPVKMQVSECLRNFNSRRCDEKMVIPL